MRLAVTVSKSNGSVQNTQLSREQYNSALQRVHVDGLDITLPCGVNKERCATDRHGTFLWERPYDDELCPLYLSRAP